MFLHKKKVQLSKDWFDTPTWLPFYSFVTKQYGGRDAMLNEYEWHPTTGNKKPRNQEIYSKKITGLYHVMFNWRYESLHHAKRNCSVQTELVKLSTLDKFRLN